MDCDKAIYRVYGYLDGELTVWRRWTIRRHLGKCPPCAQGFDFEIELRQVISTKCRDEVPQEHWGSPQFKAINRRLTLLWGAVFAAMVPFHVLAGTVDTQRANLLFNWVVPVALVVWALKRTNAIADGEVAR